jgi:hypothetical protein
VSIPLEDLRSKVATEVHAALDAHAVADGIDKSELVRQIVTAWAERRIHAAKVIVRSLESEGIVRNKRD